MVSVERRDNGITQSNHKCGNCTFYVKTVTLLYGYHPILPTHKNLRGLRAVP